MGSEGAIRRLKAAIYYRLSEWMVGVLLTVAVSMFIYSLSAQAKLAERQRDSEKQIALNAQIIDVIQADIKESQAATSSQIDLVLERVDQRCDSLEEILNIIANRGETGGK